MPDLVQLSAQFSPEQQYLCFPKQRVARGKESVSNPSPNNTRDSGETGEISCKTWLNKPPSRTELASPGRTTFLALGANQPHPPHRERIIARVLQHPGVASLQISENTRHSDPVMIQLFRRATASLIWSPDRKTLRRYSRDGLDYHAHIS
jgi:hypothetical protein